MKIDSENPFDVIGDEIYEFVDTYYLEHVAFKKNKEHEVATLFNRTKGQILFGIEKIIADTLGTKLTTRGIDMIEESANALNLKFSRVLFQRVIDECDGYFPLLVRGMGEGRWCPKNTPFVIVTNTKPGFGPLAVWFEALLQGAAFDTGCITRAMEMRRYLDEHCLQPNRFHSFQLRSHSTKQNAIKASLAWALGGLVGTDDLFLPHRLGLDLTKKLGLGSIPALAHTVVQNYGNTYEQELACYTEWIDYCADNNYKACAIVIDTYDANAVIKFMYPRLVHQAKNRGIIIVMRPDSGDLKKQITDIYDMAIKHNGINNTRVIVGDSLSFDDCKNIDFELLQLEIPLAFVSYGIGRKFHTDITRDTHGWAMKTTSVTVDKDIIPSMKISQDDFKTSWPGVLDVICNNGALYAIEFESDSSELSILYSWNPGTGSTQPFIRKTNFETIYERVKGADITQKVILYNSTLSTQRAMLKNKIQVERVNP